MTRKEAIEKLEAFIECWEGSFNGKCSDYGYDCGNCKLSKAQGSKIEICEYLKIALDALKQESCEDCISRNEKYIECEKVIRSLPHYER